MPSTITTMEDFACFLTYAGVKLTPEMPSVRKANAVGSHIGHASHTLQAGGDAIMPNWWGAVNPGDSIGFVAKRNNPIHLTRTTGLRSVKQMAPIQLYPVVGYGESVLHGRRAGCSTIMYTGQQPYPASYNLKDEMHMTFAERCIDTTSFDPFDYDGAYVDHVMIPAIGPGGKKVLYPTPLIKTGLYFHVGTVHRSQESDPSLDDIKTAFLGPDEGEARRAQHKIAMKHRITVMITGGKRPFLGDNTFQVGGFL